MENTLRVKLGAYALISFVSFTYLILPEKAGVSVPIFVLLQIFCLYPIVPDKRRLWFFAPLMILALNAFISDNGIWRGLNLLVGVVIYGAMFCPVNLRDASPAFLFDLTGRVFRPFRHFFLPLRWFGETKASYAKTVERVLLGLVGALAVLFVLVLLLSAADSVFENGVNNLFRSLFGIINITVFSKICFGLGVGLYLFGVVYGAFVPENEASSPEGKGKGDLIIINIILGAALAVYLVFVLIQFRYLFAGATLPYGLEYYEYARRGFFELLYLTGVNVIMILVAVHYTRDITNLGSGVTKWFNLCLNAATVVLLTSSFYRMWLYSADSGLTRLRFIVFLFLLFEGVGLIITFYYIAKPRFNIMVVYTLIALCYYLLMNIVPMDYYVAKNQVERYLQEQGDGIEYVCTLSADAASQIKLLRGTGAGWQAEAYFAGLERKRNQTAPGWQRYNLSTDVWNQR